MTHEQGETPNRPMRAMPRAGLSLRWQVASVSIVTVLLMSVFIGLYYPARNAREATADKATSLSGAAAMVALSVGVGLQLQEPSAVAAAFAWARRDSALRYVAVLDSTGERVATYDPDHLGLNLAAHRSRYDVHEWNQHFVVAAPVGFQDRALGTVILASSLQPIRLMAARERRNGLAASALILLVGFALSLWVAARIAKPVVDLRRAAEHVAAGDYSVAVEHESRGEVGALSAAFATMVGTIRKQMADLASQATELAVTRDAALDAAAAKSAFMATMSHEIRTPMNGVMGMLELLRDTPLDAEQKMYTETASRSANSLLQVINDILDFSKIEAGRLTIEQHPFDFRITITDIARMLAPAARAKGLQLQVVYPASAPTAFVGDAGRLRQVLTNLVGNAVKFTHQGHVAIRVTPIEGSSRGCRLQVDIHDTGIGIPLEAQAHLFQPFSQADSSTSRRYGGTGLGLAICKELIALMGGTIGVDSVEGEGSRFWFVVDLPVASATASAQSNLLVKAPASTPSIAPELAPSLSVGASS
ncbi:MAG: HAMP domain-containing protein [Gemmatimonadaceae bacterium]|nr:HAMP domain-containing protein [Gemmatimonadaceae bacterium]